MNGISKEEIEEGKEEKGKAQYQKGSCELIGIFWLVFKSVILENE